MALFGGARDISLFRHLNRELINEIIDTQCDIYKYSIFDSKENLYGEALNKVFKPGVRVSGLIDKEGKEYTSEELGADFTRQVKFSFLRDDLASLFIGREPTVEDTPGDLSWNETLPNQNAQNANLFLEILYLLANIFLVKIQLMTTAVEVMVLLGQLLLKHTR